MSKAGGGKRMILTKEVVLSKKKNERVTVHEYTNAADRSFNVLAFKLLVNGKDDPEYASKLNYLYAVVCTASHVNIPDAIFVVASDPPEVVQAGYETAQNQMTKAAYKTWLDEVNAINEEGADESEAPPTTTTESAKT